MERSPFWKQNTTREVGINFLHVFTILCLKNIHEQENIPSHELNYKSIVLFFNMIYWLKTIQKVYINMILFWNHLCFYCFLFLFVLFLQDSFWTSRLQLWMSLDGHLMVYFYSCFATVVFVSLAGLHSTL